jgi:hypothetical protein
MSADRKKILVRKRWRNSLHLVEIQMDSVRFGEGGGVASEDGEGCGGRLFRSLNIMQKNFGRNALAALRIDPHGGNSIA